ncbi:ABC transporter permease [Halobacillus locisalis]|uniref:ABC transporter permease n=1 Tax=Halobacillus locisalis TaxID=220753 RepID=A0A838CXH8_9BACI|nr:ABC transporter permease [Halobacillus locisalis]MBA2176670.1 ABC transporter permease [Halobacillus locisalis]
MNNFVKLIRNEQMKMYSQITTKVMVITFAILILAFGIFQKVDDSFLSGGDVPSGDDWKEVLQEQNDLLQGEDGSREAIQYPAFMDVEVNQYYIDNNIKPTTFDAWDFVQMNKGFISIISLFTIIVAASIVANEFKWGTIKLLLIRPISRAKLLLAKYVSVLIFALTLLVFLYVFSFVVGGALFGIDSISQTYVFRQGDSIEQAPIFAHTAFRYLLSSINLVMMATFAFMISAVFRNSSLSIGIAIFLMMAGNSILLFLAGREWAKYILFANTDLTVYLEGGPMFEGMTAVFSVGVLIVYYVLFIVLAWLFFTKRDVANA